jgi:predicted Ser/Thr protein kinase
LQKDILGPDKGPINFHAAAAGSAESITRIQQQGDKSRDTLQVLHDILDVLKGQNAGPQVNLVPAGFGG